MSKFNPDRERRRLMKNGVIALYLAGVETKIARDRALASWGASSLRVATYSVIVGLDQAAIALLDQANRFIARAIEEDERPERYFPHGTEAERATDFALCCWLRNSLCHENTYAVFSSEMRLSLSTMGLLDKLDLEGIAAQVVDAGEYAWMLELFAGTRGVRPPAKPGAVRTEAETAYVIAKHKLEQEYTRPEVDAALERLLGLKMDQWLSEGHVTTAARWLKIAYWNLVSEGERPPAREVLLRCYEYLPDVKRPSGPPDPRPGRRLWPFR
jgi:hypothetical protein